MRPVCLVHNDFRPLTMRRRRNPPENIFPHRAAVIIRADEQHRPRVRIRPQRRQHILLRQIAVPVRRAANRHPLHPHSAQHTSVHRRQVRIARQQHRFALPRVQLQQHMIARRRSVMEENRLCRARRLRIQPHGFTQSALRRVQVIRVRQFRRVQRI